MSKEKMLYSTQGEMDVMVGKGSIITDTGEYDIRRIKLDNTINIDGYLIDISDEESLITLRHAIQNEREENRRTFFSNTRNRVIGWIELLKKLSDKNIIDEETATRICDIRGVIKLSLFYTGGAAQYLECSTDMDKEKNIPLYNEENMNTMATSARYLGVYLSKVDLPNIEPLKMKLLRRLKKDPNQALYLNDGKVADIPNAKEYTISGDITAKAKMILEKWNRGIEIITENDIFILRAYLKYFEEYANRQKKEIAVLREYLERGQDMEKRIMIRGKLGDYLEGKYKKASEFAYDIFAIRRSGNLAELRSVIEAFDIETRIAQNTEIFSDLKNALGIAEGRFNTNLENTDPAYRNIDPNIAKIIASKARDVIAKLSYKVG